MTAISVQPSTNWGGNNGPWSSFALQIGPQGSEQIIFVLPATSKSEIWAADPAYCLQTPVGVTDCAAAEYSWEQSSSFSEVHGEADLLQLPFNPELPLGYNGTGIVGTDRIVFGAPESGGAVLEDQALISFTYTSPFLSTGLLGLNDQQLNVTDTARFSSPLGTLYNEKAIPSLFWAYNAGSRYLSDVYASLTLGGYDVDRGGRLEDALAVPMQQNNARDLVVSVKAFQIDQGNNYTLGTGFNASIDSVVPEFWLPDEVCTVFEETFDLQWNSTYGMYLLNDAQRAQLDSTDAKIVFTLADPGAPNRSVMDIALPFRDFVLTAKYPLAGIQDDYALYYFPLKRGYVEPEYYLGHAFLQAAYLAADYHRGEFYLSQANMVSTSGANLKIVYPPGHNAGLSTGATAGIAVGAALLALILVALAAWFCCRPRWQKRRNSRFLARIEAQNAGLPSTQLDTEMHEYYGRDKRDSDFKTELDASTTARGSMATRVELESPGQSEHGSPRGKMSPRRASYGFPASPAELESRSPRMMHSRTASGSSVEPMSPLPAGGYRGELGRTSEEVHELP